MSVQIRITTDSISPSLARAIRATSNAQPILEAMGLQLAAITKRAFTDPALRAAPWAARKSGGDHQLLRKSGALWQSIRISELTSKSVTVGSDRIYAAMHQFGGTIRPKNGKALVFTIGGKKVFAGKVTIPARPFFPFKGGEMTPLAKQKIEQIARAKIAAMLR